MLKGTCLLFKLILGLGNKDIESVKKISTFYIKNGIDMIDCSADTILEIQKNLKADNFDLNRVKFCVSVALLGDVHTRKAKINKNCVQCSKCKNVCSEGAIEKFENKYRVNSLKCSGCGHCEVVCKHRAVDIYNYNSFFADIETIKNPEIKLDILELHLSIKKKKKILEAFSKVCKNYKGNISVCISRKYFGNEKINKLIKELKNIFDMYNPNFEFMLQLDGNSVNNANDEYSSNLEALAFYKQFSNLDYKIIISGGLNFKTIELLKLFGLKPYGLAFGSYARKLFNSDKTKASDLVLEVRKFYSDN